MRKSTATPDVLHRLDEVLSPAELADRRMLDHALSLGSKLGAQHSKTTGLDFRDDADLLSSTALQTLKKENVGVRREGIEFTVRPEAVDAFVRAYSARLDIIDIKQSHETRILPIEHERKKRERGAGWGW
jgi:hypothetical protein